MVLKTTYTPIAFVNGLALTDSQWVTFMGRREFSTDKGNANAEFIEWTWSQRKRIRCRNGHLEKLIITGLTWA